MAIMIPSKPRQFAANSLEDIMFQSLESMDDEYYVFHSFKIVTEREGVLFESETDFVIFHKEKGILTIEAKAGQIEYHDGAWYYGSGKPMSHDGPFNQSSMNKWKLRQFILNSNHRDLASKCKFLHAVWFPSVSEDVIRSKDLPSDADPNIILNKSALINSQPYIEKIFKTKLPNHIETKLSEKECKRLLENILCPVLDICPAISLDIDVKDIAFNRLLKEQSALINYLDDQPCAVINGVAGTGKTMIALEKAKRHAAQFEKVLFLCYNSKLKEYLGKNYANSYIDFYTIDGFGCKTCNSSSVEFNRLNEMLVDQYYAGAFEYKHIIIDEGQDFGQDRIEENDIISLLKEIVTDSNIGGTFYIFYDKLQLIQSKKVPEFISEADCKLTLYKNCRNTENIAKTSMKPFLDKQPVFCDDCVRGTNPRLHYKETAVSIEMILDKIIRKIESNGITNIVILTCRTEANSELSTLIKNNNYKNKAAFTTCRKFKGLEADAIILIDVDYHIFMEDKNMLFYVGASRAKFKLDIVTNLSQDECRELLEKLYKPEIPSRKPQKEFATAINALYVKN